jgi:hypothetical protein
MFCIVDALLDPSQFLQNIPTTPESPTAEYLFTARYLPRLYPKGIFIRQCYFQFAAQIVTMLKQFSSSSAAAASASASAADFYIVGMWGSSGIGKTAFGYYLIYRLRREFPTSSLVWTTEKGSIYLDRNNVVQSSAAALSSPVFHILDDLVPKHTDSLPGQLYLSLYSGTPTDEWRTKLIFQTAERKEFYMPLWYHFSFLLQLITDIVSGFEQVSIRSHESCCSPWYRPCSRCSTLLLL